MMSGFGAWLTEWALQIMAKARQGNAEHPDLANFPSHFPDLHHDWKYTDQFDSMTPTRVVLLLVGMSWWARNLITRGMSQFS
jgi:hypothetical protein